MGNNLFPKTASGIWITDSWFSKTWFNQFGCKLRVLLSVCLILTYQYRETIHTNTGKRYIPIQGNDTYQYRETIHTNIGKRYIPIQGNDTYQYRITIHTNTGKRYIPIQGNDTYQYISILPKSQHLTNSGFSE